MPQALIPLVWGAGNADSRPRLAISHSSCSTKALENGLYLHHPSMGGLETKGNHCSQPNVRFSGLQATCFLYPRHCFLWHPTPRRSLGFCGQCPCELSPYSKAFAGDGKCAPGLDTLHDEFLTWQRSTGIMVQSYVERLGFFAIGGGGVRCLWASSYPRNPANPEELPAVNAIPLLLITLLW